MVAFLGLFFFSRGRWSCLSKRLFTDRKLKLLNLSTVEDDCISSLQTVKRAQVSDGNSCRASRLHFLHLTINSLHSSPRRPYLKKDYVLKIKKSQTQKCINTFISQKTYTQNVWSLLQHYAGSSAHLYEVPHNCLLTANKNMTHKIQACTTASSHMTACFYVFIPREDTNRHVSSSLSSISSWVKRWPGHLTYISYKKVTMQ